MEPFSPNTNLAHARRFRSGTLLATAFLLLGSFFLMATGVDDRKLFSQWDLEWKDEWHRHASTNEVPRVLFRLVTQLGDARFLIAVSVLLLVTLVILRQWRLAAIWAFTTLGGFKVVHILKEYYGRARPQFINPIVLETSQSFPSGHAANSAMLYGMLAYLIIRWTFRTGWFIAPMLGALVTIICASRVYLGAHWTSDVIAGATLGFGWVALGMSMAEYTREY